MATPRRANRGPGAAVENRRALVAAAVVVFAEQGYDAPLSAVARRAGVGQGSLYRHFPDRVALALAVVEDDLLDLERRATHPGTTLEDLLDLVTEQAIASVGFVEIVTAAAPDERLATVADRFRAVLAGALDEARAAGRVRHTLTADDVVLAAGMVAGLVARVPAADRRRTADTAWTLLRRALGA